jgi:hypothetical protein
MYLGTYDFKKLSTELEPLAGLREILLAVKNFLDYYWC